MHPIALHTTAMAAALLMSSGWVCAQTGTDTAPSTPGQMNSTSSPNPLQVRPADGTPNSATGTQTPGTGTGSSRTMRIPGPMTEPAAGSTPSTVTMPPSDMKTEPMMTTPAPMARPARRDRG